VLQQVGDQLVHLSETLAANHANILSKLLVPTLNGPRQLAGVKACLAMPELLRGAEILSTKRTLATLAEVLRYYLARTLAPTKNGIWWGLRGFIV